MRSRCRLPTAVRGAVAAACSLFVAIAAAGHLNGHAYVEGVAVSHYTKALRGAVHPQAAGGASPGLRRLASISYQAIRLRKRRNFGRAATVYHRSIALQEEGILLQASEVPAAVAAAHTSLNLALTEKALGRLDQARTAFRKGYRMVQEFMLRDLGARVDGQQRVCWREGCSPGQQEQRALDEVLRWLATLLTAWALLETQRGKVDAARQLAQRAVRFDAGKEPVLRWQVLKPAGQ